ncbi:hypothetical protein [Bifidobacterium coryneforme]|uniref:hypothetical protein n=1 Tax=Bifidobacterium coryneforme TaxID=1687 RepID=UPI0004E5D6BB|nr:hypothetical protein [Bifidobacterium coryneforme]AII75000.1 hypothetical protein BCOR_0990 [Bifidobacterium coryneforme]
MSRALLCEEEAREYVGGIPERTFKTLCGDHVIRLGKRNYCRPSDLDEADRVLDDAADKVERLSRWVLVANSRECCQCCECRSSSSSPHVEEQAQVKGIKQNNREGNRK